MERITTYKKKQTGYTPIIITVNEVEYIQVPVTMMVPGVHVGSHGNMLHTETGLQSNVEQWNGKPVVVYHPQDTAGNYISAYSEGVTHVGTIQTPRYEDGLKANLLLNKTVLEQTSPVTYALVMGGQPLEVSIGAYATEIKTTGILQSTGETYTAETTAYMADHLALLPDAQGACSVKDGCGIRVNQQSNNQKKGGTQMDLKEALELVRGSGLEVHTIQVNETGLLARMETIRNYVYSMDSDWVSCYVKEIYDSTFVYEKNFRRNGAPKPSKLYSQEYSIAEDGSLVIDMDPVEVVAKTEYLPIQMNESKNENEKKGEQEMSKPCCPQKVEELIVNAASNFTAEDRTWLTALTEEQLEKVTPKVVQVNVGKEHVEKHLSTYKSAEEVIELLPEAIRSDIQAGLELHKERRSGLIQKIQANAKDVWAEEDLQKMETGMLEKIEKSIAKPAVYVAGEQQPAKESGSDLVMIPTV